MRATRRRRKFKFFLHSVVFTAGGWFYSAQAIMEVDFDIAAGKKPLPIAVDYDSKFTFPIEREQIKRHFSAFTDESPNPESKSGLLRLRHNTEVFEFQDSDGNGLIDTWRRYLNGYLEFEAKLNENRKIIAQKTWFQSDGLVAEVWLDTKNRGTFNEIHTYRNGKITKTLRDENEDGLHEIEIIYIIADAKPIEAGVVTAELQRNRLPESEPLVFAGIFNTDDQPQFDAELTQALAGKLSEYLAGNYSQSESIADHLRRHTNKRQNRRLYHRFEIFRSVAEILARKDYRGYILTGEIYRSPARTVLQLRIIGPDAKSLFYTASLEYSTRDFTNEKAANDIAKLLKSLREKT